MPREPNHLSHPKPARNYHEDKSHNAHDWRFQIARNASYGQHGGNDPERVGTPAGRCATLLSFSFSCRFYSFRSGTFLGGTITAPVGSRSLPSSVVGAPPCARDRRHHDHHHLCTYLSSTDSLYRYFIANLDHGTLANVALFCLDFPESEGSSSTGQSGHEDPKHEITPGGLVHDFDAEADAVQVIIASLSFFALSRTYCQVHCGVCATPL